MNAALGSEPLPLNWNTPRTSSPCFPRFRVHVRAAFCSIAQSQKISSGAFSLCFLVGRLVPTRGIEPRTSPLPRECSTPELRGRRGPPARGPDQRGDTAIAAQRVQAAQGWSMNCQGGMMWQVKHSGKKTSEFRRCWLFSAAILTAVGSTLPRGHDEAPGEC